eukprot:jgi/Mesvir1/6448/Mv19527-RA.2
MAQDASILTHLKYGDQCTFENIDSSGFISVTRAVSIPAPGYNFDRRGDERKLPYAFELQVDALSKGVSMPRNLSNCVFEILPKQQYAAQKAFTKELAKFNQQRETWRGSIEEDKKQGGIPNAAVGPEAHRQSTPIHQAAQSSLALREAAEKAEQSHNKVEYAQSVGIAVLFGQVVQLYHPGTNSFVTLKNARAALERNHMRVVAQVGGDEGSWFLIQPAYKTKVDGEKVAFWDVITFSSVKFPGVSLRVSDLADSVAQKTSAADVKSVHEVCGSKAPTPLKLLPYAVHESLIPRSSLVLHGGQAILLRHRALGMCLSYEDGHVVFQPEQSGDVLNSNLLWRLVGDAVEWAGMPVIAQKSYRLKHVATGKYLATGREIQTTLFGMTVATSTSKVKEVPLQVTGAFNSKSNLWILHPMDSMIMDGTVLPINCLVHCQNVENKGWLSATSVARQDFWMETPTTLDRKESRDAVSASERLEREVLECAPVDPSLVSLLRTIGGVMSELRAMVSELAALPEIPLLGEAPSEKTPPGSMDLLRLLMNEIAGSGIWHKVCQYSAPIQNILRSMNELVLTNNVSPLPQHVKQALLLEQGVIRVAVQLLQTIFLEKKMPLWVLSLRSHLRGESLASSRAQGAGFSPRLTASAPISLQSYLPDSHLLTDLARTCSTFLRVACTGCLHTKKYLGSRCLKILHYLMGSGITMSLTLTAVYEDNLEILQNVTNEEIEDVFRKLKESQNDIYIRLLTTICTNRGQPLPETQNRIMDCLVRQRSVLPPAQVTECPDGRPGRTLMVTYDRQGTQVQVDCQQFAARDGDHELRVDGLYKTRAERAYLSILAMMDLLSTLSLGRNGHCHEAILRALELDSGKHCLHYNNLIQVVFNDDLPFSLRLVCCKVLKNLYIDCEPHQEMKSVERMRLWLNQPEGRGPIGPRVSRTPSGTTPGRRGSVSAPSNKARVVYLIPYIVQYIQQGGDARGRRASMEMRMETMPERGAVKLDIVVMQLLRKLLTLGLFPPLGTPESPAPRLVDALVPYLEKSVAVLYDLGLSKPDIGPPSGSQSFSKGSGRREPRLSGVTPDSQVTIMVVLESLTEVCRVLELFMEFRENWQVSQAFQAFQDIHSSMLRTGSYAADSTWQRTHFQGEAPQTPENMPQRAGRPEGDRSPTTLPFPEFSSEEPAAVYREHNFGPLQARIFGTPLLGKAAVGTDHIRPVPRLLAVLLQLMRFNYVPLQALAVGLVRKATGFKSQLLRNMLKLEILFLPEELQAHEKLVHEVRELRCLCNSVRVRQAGRAGQTPSGPLNGVQRKIVAILDGFSGMCAVNPATLGKTAVSPTGAPDAWMGFPGGDMSPGGSDMAGSGATGGYTAHQVERHQVMMRLLDVHQCVAELLRIPQLTRVEGGVDLSGSAPENGTAAWATGGGSNTVNPGTEQENALWHTIIDSIFIFIHRFCLGVPAHQLLFVPHLSTILFYLNNVALHAEWAVEAVIKGNYQLCSDMELVGSIVSATFDTILHRGRRVGLIKLLQALVALDRVDGHETIKVPIRSSQILVMQQLFKYEKSVPELFTGAKGWAARHRHMLAISNYLSCVRRGNPAKERELDDAAQTLDYHIECVRLIAMCCIANNQAITQAAGLLAFDEIMTVLRTLGTLPVATAQSQPASPQPSVSRLATLSSGQPGAAGMAGKGAGGFSNLFGQGMLTTAETIASVHPLILHAVKAPYAELLNHAYMRNSQEQAVQAVRSASSRIWPNKAAPEMPLLSPSSRRPTSTAAVRGSPGGAKEGVQGGASTGAEQESVSLLGSIIAAVEAAVAEVTAVGPGSRWPPSAAQEMEATLGPRGTDGQLNATDMEVSGAPRRNGSTQLSSPAPPIPPASHEATGVNQGGTIDTVFQGIQQEIDRVRGPASPVGDEPGPTGRKIRLSGDFGSSLKVFGQARPSGGSVESGKQEMVSSWKQPHSLRVFGQRVEKPRGITDSATSNGLNASPENTLPAAANAMPRQASLSKLVPITPVTRTVSEMRDLEARRSGASGLPDVGGLSGSDPSRLLQDRGRQQSMAAREDEHKHWMGVTLSATDYVLMSALPLLTSYFRRHFKGVGDLLDIQEAELRRLASAMNQLMGALSPQQQVQGLRFLEQLRTCGFDLSQLEGGPRLGLLMRPLVVPLTVQSDKVQIEIMRRRWLRFCHVFASTFHDLSSPLSTHAQDVASISGSQSDTLNLAALLSSSEVVATGTMPLPMPLVVQQLARFLPAFSKSKGATEGGPIHKASLWEHKGVIIKVLRALRATLYLTEATVAAGGGRAHRGRGLTQENQARWASATGQAARTGTAGRKARYTLGGVVGEFMNMERQFESLVLGVGKAAAARQAARWVAFLEGRSLQEALGDGGMLEWVQCKYNRLGVTICAVQLASHEDHQIHYEAVLLLICLLETGRREVQETLLAFLKQETTFFDKLKQVLQTAIADSDIYRRTMKNMWRQMAAMRVAAAARQEEMHTPEGGLAAAEASADGGEAYGLFSPMLGSPIYQTLVTSPLFDGVLDNTPLSAASMGSMHGAMSSGHNSPSTSTRSTPQMSPHRGPSRSARHLSFSGKVFSPKTKIVAAAAAAAASAGAAAALLDRSGSDGARSAQAQSEPPAAPGNTAAAKPGDSNNTAARASRESLDEITPLVSISPTTHSARMLDAAADIAASMGQTPPQSPRGGRSTLIAEVSSSRATAEEGHHRDGAVEWRLMDTQVVRESPEVGSITMVSVSAAGRQKGTRNVRRSSSFGEGRVLDPPDITRASDAPSLSSPSLHRRHTSEDLKPTLQHDNLPVEAASTPFKSLRVKTRRSSLSSYLSRRQESGLSPGHSPRASISRRMSWTSRRERESSYGSRQSDGQLGVSFLRELQAQALTDEEPAFNVATHLTTLESGHFVSVMRLLQLMCEGQKAEMQHLMRIQPDNVNSYDVIRQTILFLECLQPMLLDSMNGGDATIILIIIQIFHFIYEVIQGPCFENQLAVVRSSLLRVSTHIFMSLDYVLPSAAPTAAAETSEVTDTDSFTSFMGWKGLQSAWKPRRRTRTQNDFFGSWSVAGMPSAGAGTSTQQHENQQQQQEQHHQQLPDLAARQAINPGAGSAGAAATTSSFSTGPQGAPRWDVFLARITGRRGQATPTAVTGGAPTLPWPQNAGHSGATPTGPLQNHRRRSMTRPSVTSRSASAPVLSSSRHHFGRPSKAFNTRSSTPTGVPRARLQGSTLAAANFNDLRCELKVAILDLYLGLLDELGDNTEIPDKMADVLDFRALLRNTLRVMALLNGHKRDEVQRRMWASFSKSTRKVLLVEEALKGLLLARKLDDRISAQMPAVPRQGGFTGTSSLHHKATGPQAKLRALARGHEQRQCTWHTGCGKPQFVGPHCLEHAISHDEQLSNFLNANTCTVEILRNGNIECALFLLPHISKLIAADRKLQAATVAALQDVPRDNPKEKMQCFLGKLKLWLFKIRLAKGTKGTNKKSARPLWYLLEYRSLISRTPFYISLLILLLVTIWYGSDSDSWRNNVVPWAFVKALGILQILVGIICLLLFLMSESPLLLYKAQHKRGYQERTSSSSNGGGSSSSSSNGGGGSSGGLMCWLCRHVRGAPRDSGAQQGKEMKIPLGMATNGDHHGLAADIEQQRADRHGSKMPANLEESRSSLLAQYDDPSQLLPPPPRASARPLRNWAIVQVVLLSPHFWYTCVMLVASFLGVLISPFFFAVHLVDFIIYNPSGSIVLEAVIVGGPLLLKTALVGVLVIFLFSIVTFVAYNANNDSCETFYQCMGLHMVYGLMPEVVIGTVIDPEGWQYVPSTITRDSAHQTQTFFLLTFYIIWMFLLSNVITGQIVDAFGYIRLRKATMAKDLNERCFICSIERHRFGQHPDAFKEHIERDHNPLSYLYFVDYVSSKDPTECTGLENYVLQCVKADSVDWIPVARSLKLERLKPAGSQEGTHTENTAMPATSGAEAGAYKGPLERMGKTAYQRHGLDMWGGSPLGRQRPQQAAGHESMRQQLEELVGKAKQMDGMMETMDELRARLSAMERAVASKQPGSGTPGKAPATAARENTGAPGSSSAVNVEGSKQPHLKLWK